jgi:sugar phosphate isomerase/epimerase
MARNLNSNGPGHNSGVSVVEKPFFDRIVALKRTMEACREDIKVVKAEARDADVKVTHLEHAIKLYLEPEERRNARLEKEAEAERILRALGEFVNTPLGEAAMESATA